jgi:hypothetical protein
MPRQTLKNKQSPGREDADPSVAFYNVYAQRPRRANRAVAQKSNERCGEAFVEGLAYIDQSMDGRTDVHATNDLRFVSLLVICRRCLRRRFGDCSFSPYVLSTSMSYAIRSFCRAASPRSCVSFF